jgi:[ribosomal protein S5]-alanine N-acetyltransferase
MTAIIATTDQIHLRFATIEDAPVFLTFYNEVRTFAAEFEPARSAEFYTLAGQRNNLENALSQMVQDKAYPFCICLNSTGEIVGRINLNNVVRGFFQSCNVGYIVHQKYNGRGFATTALRLLINYAFTELNLHRLEAGTLPHNYASQRVLEKAGFRREGYAKNYLFINGKWQDHLIFAKTVEDPEII